MENEQFEKAAKRALGGDDVMITPRELLGWWGASRRGRNIVSKIRKQLSRKKVGTFPDFESAYVDSDIRLMPLKKAEKPQKGGKTETPSKTPEETGGSQAVEPAHRVSRLQAANRTPVSIRPGDSLEKAVTLMLQNDYSQLPVMPSPSRVEGMVSWRSVGRVLHVSGSCSSVSKCMEQHREVRETASLFDLVQSVAQHDAVLVRAENGLICGIVTNADISLQFGALAEPFLLLGDIESVLRCLIERSFEVAQLQDAVDPADGTREVESVNDLTFGEYLRLIEKPSNWDRLALPLDRAEVVKQLEDIREIRNDVMHFDPDPLDAKSLSLLRSFAKFLNGLLGLVEQSNGS